MRFYLASSFKRKIECETIKTLLEANCHSVPDQWWNIDSKNQGPDEQREWHNESFVKAINIRHFKCIEKCDALILVGKAFEVTAFNGANIEVGYALGKGIPVFSYGELAKSAMYSNVIQCSNFDELLECIEIFTLQKR